MERILVLNLVGLTERLVDSGAMPRTQAYARSQERLHLVPPLPAVTCTAQADMLMGVPANRHGAVANGWYFRELSEVWLWRQSISLLEGGGESLFQRWRRNRPGQLSAQLFWWWNLPSHADLSLTPRPTYWSDGRKSPDVHSFPPELRQTLTEELGEFPLFHFWGPLADIRSTRWIAEAILHTLRRRDVGLILGYLPHLDYDLQRFGPDSAQARTAAGELDVEVGRILDAAELEGTTVLLLSEYGIEEVQQAAFPNRCLRDAGLLAVHPARNGALLDPGNSRAFAVCDHQLAHVYIREAKDLKRVRELLGSLDGVDQVLDREQLIAHGLDHARSGELVLVAKPGWWFAYPYWSGEDQEPDFARTVDIHRKPGYDPCELLFDPEIHLLKPRLGLKLLAKKLGFRTRMDVIPLDTSLVRGSHGRMPSSAEAGPIWIGPKHLAPQADRIHACEALARIAADGAPSDSA